MALKDLALCFVIFFDAKVIGYSLKPKENDLFKLGKLIS